MKKLIKNTLVLMALVLTGCATNVSGLVERPAQLDINGAKSIAVLPFLEDEKVTGFKFSLTEFLFTDITVKNSDRSNIAKRLTNRICDEIIEANFLDLISSDAVKKALDSNSEIPCDLYLTGHIESFRDNIDYSTYTYEKDDKKITEKKYYKTVDVRIILELIDSDTSRVMAHTSYNLNGKSGEYDSKRELPDSCDIVSGEINFAARDIVKKFQPYKEYVYYTLMKDTTKSNDMKQADKMAKKGNYEDAAEYFASIYNESGLMEAGYNAGVLYLITQDFTKAKNIISDVAEKTGNLQAKKMLLNIDKESEFQNKVKDQRGN